MKPYLLIVWEEGAPEGGTGDWIGAFSTHAEAKAEGERLTEFERDPLAVVSGDNYQIVDVRGWTGGE